MFPLQHYFFFLVIIRHTYQFSSYPSPLILAPLFLPWNSYCCSGCQCTAAIYFLLFLVFLVRRIPLWGLAFFLQCPSDFYFVLWVTVFINLIAQNVLHVPLRLVSICPFKESLILCDFFLLPWNRLLLLGALVFWFTTAYYIILKWCPFFPLIVFFGNNWSFIILKA